MIELLFTCNVTRSWSFDKPQNYYVKINLGKNPKNNQIIFKKIPQFLMFIHKLPKDKKTFKEYALIFSIREITSSQ